jgi:endonuclease/exonuclease/phosphatase family metal-dependent hydrolase
MSNLNAAIQNATMGLSGMPYPVAKLRFLSYNIQAGIATQRFSHYLTKGWKHVLPHPESLDNLDHIARIVRDFDIVGLEEVDSGSLRSAFINQTEYLARRARFPYWYHQANRNLGRFAQTCNGLLSRIPPSSIVEHRLPGRIPGRGAMLVHYGQGPEALVVLILHLALGRRARLEQMQYLTQVLRGYEHVIVMGDLNCTSDSAEMVHLLEAMQLREPLRGLNTFPSWRPIVGLDHILVSSSLRVKHAEVLTVPFSDHLPVAVEVDLPQGLELHL